MERVMIKRKRLQRLIERGVLAEEELDRVLRESENSNAWPEEVLIKNNVPRHEVLLSLAGYYGCPFVEYDEGVVLSRPLMKRLDMEELKRLLWVPLSASEENAEVAAYLPGDDQVISRQIGYHLGTVSGNRKGDPEEPLEFLHIQPLHERS